MRSKYLEDEALVLLPVQDFLEEESDGFFPGR
jgi:hypothetical protein